MKAIIALLLMSLSASASELREAKDLRMLTAQLVEAAGGNRTSGQPGNQRALKWLKGEAGKLSGWSIETHEFTPDLDFAIAGYKKDLAVFDKLPKDHPQRVAAT